MFSGDRRFVDADQQGWRLHTHWCEGADGHAPRATLMICRDDRNAGDGAAHRFTKAVAIGIDADWVRRPAKGQLRSEEHTSELQSLVRISYAVFCLKKKRETKQSTLDCVMQHVTKS